MIATHWSIEDLVVRMSYHRSVFYTVCSNFILVFQWVITMLAVWSISHSRVSITLQTAKQVCLIKRAAKLLFLWAFPTQFLGYAFDFEFASAPKVCDTMSAVGFFLYFYSLLLTYLFFYTRARLVVLRSNHKGQEFILKLVRMVLLISFPCGLLFPVYSFGSIKNGR